MPSNDRAVLRDLAKQYRDLTLDPLQQARRELWRKHNSLKPQRPLILATYGMLKEGVSIDRLDCGFDLTPRADGVQAVYKTLFVHGCTPISGK